MVSFSTIKTEDGKVSCETPNGTVINININQRSALDCLLDTIRTLRTKTEKKPFSVAMKPVSGSPPAMRVGLGVSMMSMGVVSVMLAVILCVVRPNLILLYSGTLFWVGFPFIVCGALNIVAYRYPNAFWEILTFIGLLLTLSVSIAGLVMAVNDQQRFSWSNNYSSVCDDLLNRQDNNYYGYGTTRPPTRRYSDSYWDLRRCKEGMERYKTLVSALVIMTMLLMIWGICVSAFALGYRLKALYSSCTCQKPAEEEDDVILPANPPGEIFTV